MHGDCPASGAEAAVPRHRACSTPEADPFDGFDPCDWAWEFLRRNPDYVAAWRMSAQRRLPVATLNDGTRLLRLRRRYPQAERWGLYAFADPACSGRDAPVFWLPSVSRRVVRARCSATDGTENGTTLTLSNFAAKRLAVIGADGIPVVTMKADGINIGLAAHGWQVLTRPMTLTFELDAFHDLGTQTECIRLLQRLSEIDDSRQIGRSPWSNDERLRHTLIALDGSLASKTYREIAIMIFGEERVAADWNGPSRFMKDRARRLVAKGHELMKGGYRELLR
jgi:hypothetical protein